MEARIEINERSQNSELCVDAYARLTKRGFARKLAKLEGVEIIQQPVLFSKGDFCKFKFRGERFSVQEDATDYSYNIIPETHNTDTLQSLEKYFSGLNIPKQKTRPVFWVVGIALVGVAIYANLFSS